MATSSDPIVERYIDTPGGETYGWLVRYGAGCSLWCGELSFDDFRRQPTEIREALHNDLGWFIIDYESGDVANAKVLGKAASEEAGLKLLDLIVRARLAEPGLPGVLYNIGSAPDAGPTVTCRGLARSGPRAPSAYPQMVDADAMRPAR